MNEPTGDKSRAQDPHARHHSRRSEASARCRLAAHHHPDYAPTILALVSALTMTAYLALWALATPVPSTSPTSVTTPAEAKLLPGAALRHTTNPRTAYRNPKPTALVTMVTWPLLDDHRAVTMYLPISLRFWQSLPKTGACIPRSTP